MKPRHTIFARASSDHRPVAELAALRGGLEISHCRIRISDCQQGRHVLTRLAALRGGLAAPVAAIRVRATPENAKSLLS
jgi:hypothetical protein